MSEPAQIVTSFTDYSVEPLYFTDVIRTEMEGMDIPGMTNNLIGGVNVTLTHPLVRLTASVLASGGTGSVNTKGILPGISVVEEDENEENEELGYNYRIPEAITSETITKLRAVEIPDRFKDYILTNRQIDIMEAAVEAAGGEVLALIKAHWLRTSVMISLWTTSVQDGLVIGRALRGVVLRLKQKLGLKGARDQRITRSSGLVNMNFGQILHGQEFKVSFLNYVRTFDITDQPSFNFIFDKDPCNIDIIDPVTGETLQVSCKVSNKGIYRPVGIPDQYADNNPGSEVKVDE